MKTLLVIFITLHFCFICLLSLVCLDQNKKINELENRLDNFRSNFEEAGHYTEMAKARDIILAYEKNYEVMQDNVEVIRQLFINERIMRNRKMSLTEMKEIRAIIGKPDGFYYEVKE